jgi:microcystin-dependent protein
VNIANYTGDSGAATAHATGSGTAHNNLQPYIVVNTFIRAA